jgi:hypothetical protein
MHNSLEEDADNAVVPYRYGAAPKRGGTRRERISASQIGVASKADGAQLTYPHRTYPYRLPDSRHNDPSDTNNLI